MNNIGEKKYKLSVIVAVAENNAIGKDNRLLWHISEDLKYFKRITNGSPVIMGHKTWLSIGKPLPGRRNIVLSRSLCQSFDKTLDSNFDKSSDKTLDSNFDKSSDKSQDTQIDKAHDLAVAKTTGSSQAEYRYLIPGAELYASLEEALNDIHPLDSGEAFIIGGGEVYKQALPIADKLYLTKVHVTVNDADTFFPEIDPTQWREIFSESHPRGERFEHPFEFIVYDRF